MWVMLKSRAGIGGDRRPSPSVVARQVDSDRLVLRLLEQRHDTMPVPRGATGARNECERRHGLQPNAP
jgi:hypothetical protein